MTGVGSPAVAHRRSTFSESSIARCGLDRLRFDEPNLVINAGLLAAAIRAWAASLLPGEPRIGEVAVQVALSRLADSRSLTCPGLAADERGLVAPTLSPPK